MNGAREYAKLFKTGQYGRLYLVSGSHARGLTFKIFVLPEDEDARPNGDCNPPLNKDAVEVYGVISGQPGWTESYGWLHHGKWEQDFAALVEARRAEVAAEEQSREQSIRVAESADQQRKAELLATYR